jgi:hypothetical protein
MKKFFKKQLLLFGSLLTVAGLSFVSSQEAEVTAQTDPKLCDYDVDCGPNDENCCSDVLTTIPCHCDNQC